MSAATLGPSSIAGNISTPPSFGTTSRTGALLVVLPHLAKRSRKSAQIAQDRVPFNEGFSLENYCMEF